MLMEAITAKELYDNVALFAEKFGWDIPIELLDPKENMTWQIAGMGLRLKGFGKQPHILCVIIPGSKTADENNL